MSTADGGGLSGRLALVTGASRGIGAATALELARLGGDVAVNYRQERDAADEVVEAIRGMGRRARAYRADVCDYRQVEEMAQAIGEELGAVDILVNNAGVHHGGRIQTIPPEDFALVLDTAVKGAFNCTRMVIPGMVERGWGRIVNMTSVIGLRGFPGDSAYAAAKAGIVGFTKALAREVARSGILVNAVAPGYITTDMTMGISERGREKMLEVTPMRRPGTPEEVARTVGFLVSEGTYMSGAVVQVDGGMGA